MMFSLLSIFALLIPSASALIPLGCHDVRAVRATSVVPKTFWERGPAGCASKCDGLSLVGFQPVNATANGGLCWCFGSLPSPSPARTCNPPATVNLFYTERKSGACRLETIPLVGLKAAYNPHRASYENREMRLSMMGDGSGTRVAVPQDFLHGIYQADAEASNVPGVVTAFYLRSDYHQETRDFSEIDFEWLNGRPGVPDGVWLNSFEKGISNGETLLRPADYQGMLKTRNVTSRFWTTYTIDWGRSSVKWNMNGTVVQARTNGQTLRWKDMNGVQKQRTFVSPTRASHATFSIWTSSGSAFGGFGGTIPSSQRGRMFSSRFRNHRRVVCA